MWILSKPSVFTYCVCIWSFGRARSSKCTSLVCFGARRAHTHFSLGNSVSRADCTFNSFIKHVQQFSNCKDGILQQQSTDDCLHFRPVAVILNGVYLMFFLASKDYSCVSSRTTSFSSQRRAFVPPWPKLNVRIRII